MGGFQFYIFVFLTLALWIILNALHNKPHYDQSTNYNILRKLKYCNWSMLLAHIGVGISVIGMSLSIGYEQEKQLPLAVGNEVNIQDYKIKFLSMDTFHHQNYQVIEAKLALYNSQHKKIAILQPQQRYYSDAKVLLSKTDIHAGVFQDIYIVFSEHISANKWAFRIYYKPFIRWIWFGGLLICLSGFLILLRRRQIKER